MLIEHIPLFSWSIFDRAVHFVRPFARAVVMRIRPDEDLVNGEGGKIVDVANGALLRQKARKGGSGRQTTIAELGGVGHGFPGESRMFGAGTGRAHRPLLEAGKMGVDPDEDLLL